jgi:hypothetical protein
MKNPIAQMLTFENVLNLGFAAPHSELVDFSDDTYNQAAEMCEIKENKEFGVKALFVGEKMERVQFDFAGPEWFREADVEDWSDVVKIF